MRSLMGYAALESMLGVLATEPRDFIESRIVFDPPDPEPQRHGNKYRSRLKKGKPLFHV